MVLFFCIPCLVLIAYFGIAGIFFPKYRGYIKEGWECFLNKLRGRICSASFDNKMRLALSMWFTERGVPSLGRFFHNRRNFELTLIVIGVASTAVSMYLFALLMKFLIHSPCVEGVCHVPVG